MNSKVGTKLDMKDLGLVYDLKKKKKASPIKRLKG